MAGTTDPGETERPPPEVREVPTRMLVLGMLRPDGTVSAGELADVAAACGQSTEQVRSCLRRLVTEGILARDDRERPAVYVVSAGGLASLGTHAERHRLAYAQDAAGHGWDGRWRLVAFAVPESRRTGRDALRDRLRVLGGAPIHNGLWVSPHRWGKEVRDEADRLGIGAHLTLASSEELSVGGVSDARDLAARLWPVADLAQRYRAFVERYDPWIDALSAMRERCERLLEGDFLAGALEMGVAFGSCFGADPLLPSDLLPRPWPGRTARDLVVRARRMALAQRAAAERPTLFRAYDDLIDSLP